MRLWLCPSSFAPHRGGVEELTLKLAHQLSHRGHEVLVVTNRHPDILPAADVVEGVQVRRVQFSLPARRPASLLRHAVDAPRARRQLADLPAPDLVHVICLSSQTAALTGYSRSRHLPLVLTTQGETEMDSQAIYHKNPWLRRDLRRAARSARVLTACSDWTRRHTSAYAPEFLRAEVVLNGVQPDDWLLEERPDKPVFAAWGRHVREKGFDLLLRAFPRVRAELPESRLLIGGDGPERRNLIDQSGVEFLGSLDRAGVRRMLAATRVAVVPSRLEPFGIVALEALAAGRGLVYSSNGGLAEAAGSCGRPADPTDAEALADAMVAEHLAPTPVKEARNRARSVAWPIIAEQYEQLYHRAAGESPGLL